MNKLLNIKVKSFTVAEMLVVMAISGVLILIALSALRLTQRHMNKLSENMERNEQLYALERMLWQDFNRYSLFYDDKQELLLGHSPTDSVRYTFYDSYILRNTDTIPIAIPEKSLFLNAEKVNAGQVDALELVLDERGSMLFCFQEKDPTYYLNSKSQ